MEQNNLGIVKIADDVIAIIACTATLEIDGVSDLAGSLANGFIERLSKKNSVKGVGVEVEDGKVTVGLNVILLHDNKIQEVASAVQQKVKTSIETMTGLEVMAVNVNVVGIEFEKNKPINDAE